MVPRASRPARGLSSIPSPQRLCLNYSEKTWLLDTEYSPLAEHKSSVAPILFDVAIRDLTGKVGIGSRIDYTQHSKVFSSQGGSQHYIMTTGMATENDL